MAERGQQFVEEISTPSTTYDKRIGAMAEILDEKTKVDIRRFFEVLVSPVKLVFFTQSNPCPTCSIQNEILKELVGQTDKLVLEVYDFIADHEKKVMYEIDKIPATVVMGTKDHGIRFYGLTAGYEFTSLVEAIIMESTSQSGLDPQLEALVRRVERDVHVQVMVTITCPYCPKMVHVANQFAFVNDHIRADTVEASEFPQLVQKYEVGTTPKTIINDVHSFEGAIPPGDFYLEILKAVDLDEYRRIKQTLEDMQGTRKTKRAEESHLYELIVVGGGPAAMSAAIFAARKGLDVALVTEKLGGQITNTARIENYIGFPSIEGNELAESFRVHLESFPVSEAVGAKVMGIKIESNKFKVITEDKRSFKANALIYCAGKEYRRLGILGEDRFIGRGIGFCATCDAPLYRDKRVAVVGGGNSAFTSARDLLSFASEVHIIHRRKEFKADPALVDEVLVAKNITIHVPMIVRSFLGKDKLTGVRLESDDGKERYDINVDGVFLEVGLTPNTAPLRDIIALNEFGEVIVNKDMSTGIPGLYAAGDVTDIEEKQVSIAAGQGALAAITAHKYLAKQKLTTSKMGLREIWQ